jgi:hemolysin activation/secretion protein
MERQLLLVNEIPGVRVKNTALEELGRATGRFRLIVTVETWRIYWAQGIDNFGGAAVGPLQAYTGLSFNSYLVRGDTLGIAGTAIPDDPSALSFGRLFYEVPVDNRGSLIGFSAMQSAVRPTDPRRFYHNATRTSGYELRGSILPLQERYTSLRLTAAFNISDVSETDDGGTYYKDRLRIVSLAGDYKLKDGLEGWNYLTAVVRHGVKVMGASHQEDWTSIYGASNDFTTVNLAYTRLQKITDIWSIKVATSAQFASNTLLLSQQFYLGSAGFGPGFYSGDNGFSGVAELRLDQETNWALLKGYQVYGFVDGCQVWNAAGGRASLASVGAGTRFFVTDQLQAGLSVAMPIYDSFGADTADFRVLFSVLNAFKMCPSKPELWCG